MKSGAKQLRDWINRTHRNQFETGEFFGVSEGYISMMLKGTRTPSRKLAVKIATLTGIPVASWVLSVPYKTTSAPAENGVSE